MASSRTAQRAPWVRALPQPARWGSPGPGLLLGDAELCVERPRLQGGCDAGLASSASHSPPRRPEEPPELRA